MSAARLPLVCRDNMDQLLAQGMPADRSMEKTLRAWLANCHEQLDKTTTFNGLLPEQALLRKQHGESATFFASMTDGIRTIQVCPVSARLWRFACIWCCKQQQSFDLCGNALVCCSNVSGRC